MRTLLLLTSLLLSVDDASTPPPIAPDQAVVGIPIAQIKALLGDNLRLRNAVMDALEQRDSARDALQTCVVARSA